ncbi:MAG: uracil-DNA glycosylase [Oscillospiraceae bacterium]|nr:uracil-DNA glycosylase [Oscillospiraceae bacterium]
MQNLLGLWQPLLCAELEKPYWAALCARVAAAETAGPVYPPASERFRALLLTPPGQVRAVILGQDPYHEPGQANGLAFSVRRGVRLPPSLRNLFQELADDLHCPPPADGDLSGWAAQGVLLLNTVLSVSAGQANSHKDFGWQTFTDAVVEAIRALPQPIAFVLWGAQAQKKAAAAAGASGPRLILRAPHPSPLSVYRGFFGSRPFSRVNAFLTEHGEAPIDFSR